MAENPLCTHAPNLRHTYGYANVRDQISKQYKTHRSAANIAGEKGGEYLRFNLNNKPETLVRGKWFIILSLAVLPPTYTCPVHIHKNNTQYYSVLLWPIRERADVFNMFVCRRVIIGMYTKVPHRKTKQTNNNKPSELGSSSSAVPNTHRHTHTRSYMCVMHAARNRKCFRSM